MWVFNSKANCSYFRDAYRNYGSGHGNWNVDFQTKLWLKLYPDSAVEKSVSEVSVSVQFMSVNVHPPPSGLICRVESCVVLTCYVVIRAWGLGRVEWNTYKKNLKRSDQINPHLSLCSITQHCKSVTMSTFFLILSHTWIFLSTSLSLWLYVHPFVLFPLSNFYPGPICSFSREEVSSNSKLDQNWLNRTWLKKESVHLFMEEHWLLRRLEILKEYLISYFLWWAICIEALFKFLQEFLT